MSITTILTAESTKNVTRVVMLASIGFATTVAMLNAGTDPEFAAAAFKGGALIFGIGLLYMALFGLFAAVKPIKNEAPVPAGPVAVSGEGAESPARNMVDLNGYRDSGFLGGNSDSTEASYEKVAA